MKSIVFGSVEEASKVLRENRNKGYILHVPINLIGDLAAHAHDQVVMVSTAGLYSNKGYGKGAITGFEYNQDIGEIIEINELPILSKDALRAGYEKVKNNKNAFMLLFLDGISAAEESIMTTLYFMKNDFKVIGGSAGDDLAFKETAIYIGNMRVAHAAVFFDSHSRTQLLKENIYVPKGDKLLITEADPINRIVYKIDNEPAATVYARLLGVPEKELNRHFMNNPLGKIYLDDIFIASPKQVNGDKSITFYCQILPNTFLYLLEATDPLERVNETLSKLLFRPKFVYSINCILRSLKFQNDQLWGDIDGCLLGTCSNITGFISYGEQFYKHHINQTMVLLAVE